MVRKQAEKVKREGRKLLPKSNRPEKILLMQIKKRLPELKTLLSEIQGHWVYEDGIYRFYHQSFKVYN